MTYQLKENTLLPPDPSERIPEYRDYSLENRLLVGAILLAVGFDCWLIWFWTAH